jgi:hypothetical protein
VDKKEPLIPKVTPLASASRPKTNKEIWDTLIEQNAQHLKRDEVIDAIIETTILDVREVKMRMKSYEDSLKTSNDTLNSIKMTTDFLSKVVKVARWIFLAVAAALIGQFGLYVWHLLPR